MKRLKYFALGGALLLPTFFLIGCGSKDVDPQAKVDAPGYYNGPLKPKGDKAGGGASTETGK